MSINEETFLNMLTSTSSLLKEIQVEAIAQKMILVAMVAEMSREQRQRSSETIRTLCVIPPNSEDITLLLKQSLNRAVDFFEASAKPTPDELRKMFHVISGGKDNSCYVVMDALTCVLFEKSIKS